MAEYGPLEPSNRLEWFLANGGGNGGSGGGGDKTGLFLNIRAINQTTENIFFPILNIGSDGEISAGMEYINAGSSGVDIDCTLYVDSLSGLNLTFTHGADVSVSVTDIDGCEVEADFNSVQISSITKDVPSFTLRFQSFS